MARIRFSLTVFLTLASSVGPAGSVLRIVTTTQDLAAIAREIGGERVEVEALAKGYQDPHFVDAKPSHILKLRKADLFIQVGLDLEIAWARQLVDSSRNRKIAFGRPGFLDVSEGCDILQKPQKKADRSEGDIHPYGNPHYWLDPANGLIIAKNIAARLSEIDPAYKTTYEENRQAFERQYAAKRQQWDKAAQAFRSLRVVTYHNSWPNFAKAFGIDVRNFVEPKPGIHPSPAHVEALIRQIKEERIPLILMEPYFDEKLPRKIAEASGAKLVIFLPSVGAEKDVITYFDLFERNLEKLRQAIEPEKH